MLLLSTSSFTIDDVTVFPDHENKNQFWYLPGPVGIASVPGSDEPQFSLLEYAPDVGGAGVKGVGFLAVTVCLKLRDETRAKIMGQIGQTFPDSDNPTLAPANFDEGTVQIMALDLQGGGGASNAAPPGAFQAVEHVYGAVTPELFGDNNAVFGLSLSDDGATMLKAALEHGLTPIGCLYNLKFTGVRPALDVEITADLKRVYDSFSIGLSAEYSYVTVGIDATFEKLRQDGAIQIKVVNLTTDQSNADAEKQALDLFKQQILAQWFNPSLSPATAQAADAGVPSLRTSPTTSAPTASARPAGSGGALTASQPASAGAPRSPTVTGPATSGAAASASPPTAAVSHGGAPATGGAAAPQSAGAAAPASGGATQGRANAASGGAAASSPAPSGGGAPQGGGGGSTAGQVAQAASAAQSVAQSASPWGAALKLKFVHQDELKTVTYSYNRMDAVQRAYAPQGLFGLMLDGIDRSKHFLQIDGTDVFFKQFSVAITPPHDYAGIGLQTAHVALDFGDAPDSASGKHGEYVFDPTSHSPVGWDIFQGEVQSTLYRYAIDYDFDPESGWTGDMDHYQLPQTVTENRQLTLDPYATLGFLTITLTPGHIDPTVVDRVEVALQYGAPNAWQASETFVVRADSKPQSWKLRASDRANKVYSYTTRCILKDDTTFTSDPVTTGASAIIVNDAFKGSINVMIAPTLNAANTKAALVEISYSDAKSGYNYANTFFLSPAAPQPISVRIPVLDRTQNQFNYKITTISTTGEQRQGGLVTSSDPVVLVGDTP